LAAKEGCVSWQLHLGDCLDPVSGLASLPDRSVDHVLCDPPFEEAAHTLQRRVKRGNGNGSAIGDRMSIEPLPFPPISEGERQSASRQFARVAKRWDRPRTKAKQGTLL
jgi:hypothetical protein